MFKSLFGRFQSRGPATDFSAAGADMHSHLVPGIDDGSKSLEDSVSLVNSLYQLGFKKLITTPHIMSDYYKNTPAVIMEGLEHVRQAVSKENIPVVLEAAAEYYLDDGFVKKLDSERLMTFGDNHLLFEISYINCPDNINEVIFRMQVLGYKPIMAHPERYPFWYNEFDQYKHFRDNGVLLQVNINSICGYYGSEARKIAEKLIDQNMVDLIGTDTHHTKHIQALQRCTTEKYLPRVLEMNLLNKHL